MSTPVMLALISDLLSATRKYPRTLSVVTEVGGLGGLLSTGGLFTAVVQKTVPSGADAKAREVLTVPASATGTIAPVDGVAEPAPFTNVNSATGIVESLASKSRVPLTVAGLNPSGGASAVATCTTGSVSGEVSTDDGNVAAPLKRSAVSESRARRPKPSTGRLFETRCVLATIAGANGSAGMSIYATGTVDRLPDPDAPPAIQRRFPLRVIAAGTKPSPVIGTVAGFTSAMLPTLYARRPRLVPTKRYG